MLAVTFQLESQFIQTTAMFELGAQFIKPTVTFQELKVENNFAHTVTI
jgi:hypothetical protein